MVDADTTEHPRERRYDGERGGRAETEAHEQPAEVEYARRVKVENGIAEADMKPGNPARPEIAFAKHDGHGENALDMQRAIGCVDNAVRQRRQNPDEREQRGDEVAGVRPGEATAHDSSSTVSATASAPPRHSAASPRFRPRSCSAWISVTRTRAPLAPNGWPNAI